MPTSDDYALAARRWDNEYQRGRYAAEPPLPFVARILATLDAHPDIRSGPGLYVGCGNGRNYVPLADAGLDLYGLDISAEAIRQLAERRPASDDHLLVGDLRNPLPGMPYAYLIALQVFQHGTDVDAEAYFERAAELISPGGIFFLRVSSVATDIYHAHTVIERNPWGGFTLRYLDGPKRDLPVHFYSRDELAHRTSAAFEIIMEPHEDITVRTPPKKGSWVQWQAIYRRR